MKRTFVTLFPKIKNGDFYRDPCMIPYIMAKEYGFVGKLVFVKQEEDYSNFSNFMPELQLEEIESENEIYNYLKKNAKDIDILNVFFLSLKENLKWIDWYKKFNKNGIAYIKLDMSMRQAENYIFKKSPKAILKRILVKRKLHNVDMISAETTKVREVLEQYWERKVLYIPDGYYDFEKNTYDNRNIQKEKEILTVGHLGTEAKNTELLLEAYAKTNINKEYKLHLVGSRTKELDEYLESYFCKHNDLKGQVILEGVVTDRKELNSIYSRAEVFILPSKWESFGIAMLEAAVNGCFLIATDKVPAFLDIVGDDNEGACVASDNLEELIRVLDEIPHRIKNFEKEKIVISAKNFYWPNICKKICQELQ